MNKLKHIQYIIDKLGKEVEQTLNGEDVHIDLDKAMDVFLSCDPTKGKRLTDWLVKTYINGGFLWEDTESGVESKLSELLRDYITYFGKIHPEQRNIYQYKSYGELYKLIKPYLALQEDLKPDSVSGKEIKRRERNQALQESMVLYHSEEMVVAVPLTEFSSKWWGRGTKWCTAAEKNNYFHSYNNDAPLIVISIKDQDNTPIKLQLWITESRLQFMDSSDCYVKEDLVHHYWANLKPIMQWAIEQNGEIIKCIPREYRSPEICTRAVEDLGDLLGFIPNVMKTQSICDTAVTSYGLALGWVPEGMKTAETCRLAILNNGKALEYVPKEFHTPEFYEIAVRNNWKALQYTHPLLRSPLLCRIALEQNGDALAYVPKKLLDNDFYRFAVTLKGRALAYVPDELMTYELCMLAISNHGPAIRWVPEKLQTVDLWRIALENGASLGGIRDEWLTPEIYRVAVLTSVSNFRYVTEERLSAVTNTDLEKLVERSEEMVRYIPSSLLTPQLCLHAVRSNGMALGWISEKLITDRMCRVALEQNKEAMKYVPAKFITVELHKKYGKRQETVCWDEQQLLLLKYKLEHNKQEPEIAPNMELSQVLS